MAHVVIVNVYHLVTVQDQPMNMATIPSSFLILLNIIHMMFVGHTNNIVSHINKIKMGFCPPILKFIKHCGAK